jgi:3-ketoacyl-CoA synthase
MDASCLPCGIEIAEWSAGRARGAIAARQRRPPAAPPTTDAPHPRPQEYFSPESVDFLERVCAASGLGDATALTPSIKKMLFKDNTYHSTYDDCRDETYQVMFDTVGEVLRKTKIDPKEIDICITSCSCFAPMPSLTSVLVHKFSMRPDVQTFALAGMGCGASVPCVDMARQLLATLPAGAKALIVNHENITNNWYVGEDRSMLLCNALFRAGGAAIILSNSRAAGAKYRLVDVERTHMCGADSAAVDAISVECDNRGRRGVTLSKNLTRVAGAALRANLAGMASRQLPLTELARVARAGKGAVPDLTKAFDKFLLHAGGPAVLYSAIETLGLQETHMSASLDSLKHFGNTSSASTW